MVLPRRAEHSLRDERAAATDVSGKLYFPPCHLEQLDRRAPDLWLGVARERVGEKDEAAALRALACRSHRSVPSEPALKRVSMELGKRASSIDPAESFRQDAH